MLTLGFGQSLTGRGHICTRTDSLGTICPGVGVGGIGEIDTRININHLPGRIFDIEIGGTASTAFDRVLGTGTITLNGGTLRVTTFNGFDPTPGPSFTIISGPAIAGTLCETILSISWAVGYTSNAIIMEYTGCVGDTDNRSGCGVPHGGITVDDLLYFLGLFEQRLPAAHVHDGSGTALPDDDATIVDLLCYLLRFDAGC